MDNTRRYPFRTSSPTTTITDSTFAIRQNRTHGQFGSTAESGSVFELGPVDRGSSRTDRACSTV
ncbi:hypothetical protein EA473_20525 [Natrarchaeobius chitinivorans]|uniref:Uncharacterized protein n=1 Tax=Natrarchaeobius chitinivorans TaxID=1679083 RepID=A0A3N6MAR4_NATCH|nr:hypothetical protein EA473_20525 [Natrarchaeobius chitinivorans]